MKNERRNRSIVSVSVLALMLIATVVLPGGIGPGDAATRTQAVSERGVSVVLTTGSSGVAIRGTAPNFSWPASGQASIAVRGIGIVASSARQHPVPIASLTKMMTALVILRDHPLSPGAGGPLFSITPGEVVSYEAEAAAGDSTLRVVVGERLSEYQLLEGLLIPSGDNVAALLATWDAGSTAAFVAKMNATATALGLADTHYGDPAGLSPNSVSDAAD